MSYGIEYYTEARKVSAGESTLTQNEMGRLENGRGHQQTKLIITRLHAL